MAKRFYKENEKILIKELKKTGVVKILDIPNLQAKIEYYNQGKKEESFFSFTEIDKLVTVSPPSRKEKEDKVDTILFAKVNPKAIIPSKRKEDGGYDVYACFDQEEMYLPKLKPTLIPTGLAMSMLDKYCFNLKSERSSVGKHGACILSGIVDSGYRNELFINVIPLYKDIVISKDTYETTETHDAIIYPYSKAIAQGLIQYVPDVRIKEISYEQLKAIPSERGLGKLGSTNK